MILSLHLLKHEVQIRCDIVWLAKMINAGEDRNLSLEGL